MTTILASAAVRGRRHASLEHEVPSATLAPLKPEEFEPAGHELSPMRITVLLLCLILWGCQFTRTGAQSPATSSPAQNVAEVPDWADFMTAEEYRGFLAAVKTHFEEQGRNPVFDDGFVLFPGEETDLQFGLQNLAQLCHQSPPDEWSEIVAEHFQNVEKIALASEVKDFDSIRDQILLRLYHDSYTGGDGGFLTRTDLDGTMTAVVLDRPESVELLNQDEVKKWGVSADELFKLGGENFKKLPLPSPEEIVIEDVGSLFSVHGDSFFVGSLVLRLNEFPDLIGEHGCLLGVPSRHQFVCYPINDTRVISAMKYLPPLLVALDAEGPGSVTPNLYFYRNGQFLHIPYKEGDEGLTVTPPAEFVELLDKLASEDSQ